jgi:hypothetical protein
MTVAVGRSPSGELAERCRWHFFSVAIIGIVEWLAHVAPFSALMQLTPDTAL